LTALERDGATRKTIGTVFNEMLKLRYFILDDILEGFSAILPDADDFIVDYPKLWEYLAETIVPIFADGVVPLSFVASMSAAGKKEKAAPVVAAVVKELVNKQGSEAVLGMWKACNLQLSSLLLGSDPVAFADQHKLQFLLECESASNHVEKSTTSSAAAAPAHPNTLDFQIKLERYLRGTNHSTEDPRKTEEVCLWIKENSNGEVNPAFIRALVTAVTESCIDGIGTDSKLNPVALKSLSEVLRKYVDTVPELELHALFAAQALVTHRQHPKGLIQGIFEMLYDSNVVSEEGFETWVNSDDPSERDGKAVALKSLTSFLTWLKEADPESDPEESVG